MSTNENQDYNEYFEKFGVPWLTGHLQMRSQGLQVFTAIHGGLLVGWTVNSHWAFPLIALASCVSFFLWDQRVRYTLHTLTTMGRNEIDNMLFGENDNKNKGVFGFIGGQKREGGIWKRLLVLFKEGSHSWAIYVLLISFSSLWILIFIIYFLVLSTTMLLYVLS